MLDIGVTKLAIIGVIALVVIGPERLPGVARMAGNLLGRARRYMADVKAEVHRSMELDELKKMKDSVQTAARDMEKTIQTGADDFEKSWTEATQAALDAPITTRSDAETVFGQAFESTPQYRHPRKHWRIKQSAMPHWYKARAGIKTHVQSGAARVARFRPSGYSQNS
ncbi:MAG: Sec-independent protein translocase subunit TatB [Pseudomonadota bacterium]|jgi:sec-independent protein translocase protein TatB